MRAAFNRSLEKDNGLALIKKGAAVRQSVSRKSDGPSEGASHCSVADLRLPRSIATLDVGAGLGAGRGNDDQASIEQGGLRAQFEAAVADYRGAVTYCPPRAL